MKKIILLFVIIATITSCTKPFPYNYSNEEQVLDCPNSDSKLMNEALYSFKDDISNYFLKEVQEKEYKNFQYSYSQYIYRGAKGSLFFNEIVSSHTITVFRELEKKEGLFIKKKGKSNLNYNNDFVLCLINNIKSDLLRNKIKDLIKVDYLSPDVMAENYRVSINAAETDPNFLMFIALDTYYQRFLELDFPNTN